MLSDVDQVVSLVYSCGPKECDYLFTDGETKPADFIRAAFIGGSGESGYKAMGVAVVDGEVAGI